MKKIMLIVFCIFLTACSGKTEQVNNFKRDDNYKTCIYLPTDWGVKSSNYGKYYSNLEDIIIINKLEKNIKDDLKQSINFYRPDLLSLNDELEITKTDDYFSSVIKNEKVIHMISKEFEDFDQKFLLTIISDKQERAYEIYKKVFRQ